MVEEPFRLNPIPRTGQWTEGATSVSSVPGRSTAVHLL